MLTLVDVAERLKRLDETVILEVLGITTEDIINRFMDLIEEKYEELAEELDDYNRDE